MRAIRKTAATLIWSVSFALIYRLCRFLAGTHKKCKTVGPCCIRSRDFGVRPGTGPNFQGSWSSPWDLSISVLGSILNRREKLLRKNILRCCNPISCCNAPTRLDITSCTQQKSDLARKRERHLRTVRVMQMPKYGQIRQESRLLRAPSHRQLVFLSCC